MNQEVNLTKVGFGYINDQDDSLKGSDAAFAEFGLNTGKITKFEYNPNAGRDNTPADAIDITVTINDREYNRRLYDVTRVYDKNGNQITDTESEAFIKGFNENLNQVKAVVTHVVKSLGVTDQQIANALAIPPTSFADWAKVMTSIAVPNFHQIDVDVFLEYQWNIGEGQERTYLEVPKNMKGGRFLSPHIAPVGEWTEEKEWTETVDGELEKKSGLRYVDGAGNVHPFVRSQNYMESNKANQQIDGVDNSTQANFGSNATGAQAKPSSW